MRGTVRSWSATVVLLFLACLASGTIEAEPGAFDTIIDARTGVRIGIPVDIVGRDSTQQERGSNWGSRASNLSIDTLNFGNTRPLSEIFATMKSKSGRNVTAQEYRDDSFYLKGNDDHGTTQIYIRMRVLNGEVRGMAVAYDSSARARLEPVVAKIISSFEPFPASSTVAATAPATAPAPPPGNLPIEIVPPMPHSGDVNSVVASVDYDRFVASSGEDGIIKLWDTATGRLIRNVARIDPENKFWRVKRLSGDGQRLLGLVGGDGVVWDTVTGKQIVVVKEVSEDDIFMNAAGTRVVSRAKDGPIRAFDGRTGKELSIFKGVIKISFAPDGGRTVAAGADRTVYEIDTAAGSRGRILTTLDAPADSIQFSPNSKSLAIRTASGDVALWSFEQDKSLLQLKGDKDSDYTFSVDGTSLAVLRSDETVDVFDTQTGVKRASFKVPRSNLVLAGFLQDGSQIYFADKDDSSVVIVDLQSGAAVETHGTLPNSEALGSRYYASAEDESLRLRDIENGQAIRDFGGEAAVEASAFLPSGAEVAISSKRRPRIFDPQTGLVVAKCTAQDQDIYAVRISSRGQMLAYGGEAKKIDLCDVATGTTVRSLVGHDATVRTLAFSSDDRQLLSGDVNGIVKLWDVQTGTLIRTLSAGKEQRPANVVAFSPDGRRLFAGTDDNRVRIWEAATGKELKTLRMLVGPVTAMAVSPDGRRVAAGPYSELLVKQWDTDTGRELQRLETGLGGRFTTVNDVKYSPFGDGAVIAAAKNQIEMWDANTGSKKLEITYQDREFVSIAFAQDQRRIVSLDQGGVVRHWDKKTGALLLTVLSFGGGEGIQVTPEGFFDASQNGARYLSAVRGLEVYSIDQFYQSLYRPDLVREKLAGDPRGLVRAAAANLDLNKVISSGSAPDVRVTLPGRALGASTVDGESVLAEAEITNRGGGIGRVEWRVNRVTVGIDMPASANQPIRIARNLALDPGDNTIEVTAYNGANLIASLPGRISVTSQLAAPSIAPSSPAAPAPAPSPAQAAAKPRLFVLVAGVNEYADKRIRLSYAVPDASEIARGFKEAAGSLYRSVEVKLMTDADVTRDRLDAAFAEMASKISASDVFVLYLAGHGKTVDGRYYFIPQDFTIEGEFSDKTINASVKAKAIAQEQWQRWFASVPARKSVILFDTCDSGTLTGDAGQTQLLEKGAANDRLAEATGRSILTASGGSQEALEGYHGHGLFTFELLDGINYGDSDRNGTVDVSELAAYVYAQVSELSLKVFGQRQAPQMKVTANYPLVGRTRILQDETTPVAEAKPAYQLAQAARLQIKPGSGATVVRNLSARTAVTIIESRDGWSLIASDGKPIGYVATKELAPVR
jgi:WD40 repeat protein/uncharacterized caspase-like protein